MRVVLACLLVIAFVMTIDAEAAKVATAVAAKTAAVIDTHTAKVLTATANAISGVAATLADTAKKIADSTITADTLINNVNAVIGAVKDFKAGAMTLILLIAAIIKLLISAMKLPALAKFMDTPKAKAMKPYIALVLGALSGFLACLATGQDLMTSIIAGLTAGFGSIGIHETYKSVRGKNV
jgi:hypothetical protein